MLRVVGFLRQILWADALVSGSTGVLLLLGASVFAPLFGLPITFVRIVGMILVPYWLMLVFLARKDRVPRMAVWAVIVINALWAIDSIAVLVLGWIKPNGLGTAFVIAQAVIVGIFAELQFIAMRRASTISV